MGAPQLHVISRPLDDLYADNDNDEQLMCKWVGILTDTLVVNKAKPTMKKLWRLTGANVGNGDNSAGLFSMTRTTIGYWANGEMDQDWNGHT